MFILKLIEIEILSFKKFFEIYKRITNNNYLFHRSIILHSSVIYDFCALQN